MSKLKTFVGHSFTPEDEPVVRAFLKFFDQVKDMNIGFSWQHAEPAEPKVLAAKVLGLIEGKNLFIGICTKKEAVVVSENLKRGVLNKSILKAREEYFSWKTSDWIIQEIGLAKGRGMDLILLVENGLRQPGGLQGDLEYIPFDRGAPEKSFGKILEMIRALMPRAAVLAGEETDIRATPEDKPSPEEKKGGEWYRPKPDWNRREFELALMHAVATDNENVVKEIYEAYLGTEDGEVHENRESWEAWYEYSRLVFGKGGKLAKLEEFAKIYPENSEVQWYLGEGYKKYEEYSKAAKCFEMAADKAKTEEKQLKGHGEAVIAFTRSGLTDQAGFVINTMKKLVPKVEKGESLLIRTLREVAKVKDDKDLLFGLTERLLDLSPDDLETRFSLAYDYSQAGQNELSLLHYLKIPYKERDASAWNNIGVEFDRFELQSKAVNAYRKAEELGETLAMSNLAQKLINAGFLEESEKICNEAVKTRDYHKNVGNAISRIRDVLEEEDRNEKQIIERATPISEFFKDYGHALTKNTVSGHTGRWQGPDCELRIMINRNTFLAEGTYERQSPNLNALLGFNALLAKPGIGTPPEISRYRVRYEGTAQGHSVKCTFVREEEGKPAALTSLLGGLQKGVYVLMIISDSLKEIRVYERDAAKDRQFYSLTRID